MEKSCDRLINPREAIEMLMHCRKDRLSYVLDILRVAGYEFSEPELLVARAKKMTQGRVSAMNRRAKGESWPDTDDEAIALLREAYLQGVTFTDINKLTGINRTVLYTYLKGERLVPAAYRDKLIETLKELLKRGELTDG